MVLIDEILSRVIRLRSSDQNEVERRSQANDNQARKMLQRMHALKDVVMAFANRGFWDLNPDDRVKALQTILSTDPVLRRDLADAIKWSIPKDDSFELTLYAVDAALGRIEPSEAEISKGNLNWGDWKKNLELNVLEIFEGNLDWEDWKKKLDLQAMTRQLEDNQVVRTAFARAVNAYPGTRHLDKIAHEVIARPDYDQQTKEKLSLLLKKHILNWESFQNGEQDDLFRSALEKHYEFREQIARVIGSIEADQLAESAIDLWQSTPIKCSFRPTRNEVLDKLMKRGVVLQSIHGALRASGEQEPSKDGWDDLTRQLSEQFASDPISASEFWDSCGWPRPFSLVLREELVEIEERRDLGRPAGESAEARCAATATDAADLAVQKKLFGVAFSGGGIRSATFNLGVLQKLSHFGLLQKVDYLSTVSGGGYIGAWLAGWTAKNRGISFTEFRKRLTDLLSPRVPDPRAEAQRPIRFLREFSNYLTPKLGNFSVDTWTMAAVYSRNLLLNQSILLAVLGALLLLPRLFIYPLAMNMPHDWWMWVIAAFLLVVAVTFMSLNMSNAVAEAPELRRGSSAECKQDNLMYKPLFIRTLIVGTILLAVYLGSTWFWRHIWKLDNYKGWITVIGALFAAILSFLLSYLGGFVTKFKARQMGRNLWPFVLTMTTIISAGITVLLLNGYLLIIRYLVSLPSGVWHAEIWGPVLLLAVLMIPGTLQVGLMGVDYPDPGREWLSRFRAICSIYSFAWIAFFSAAIYGPFIVLKVSSWSIHAFKVWIATLTIGWVVTTITSLSAGNSKQTGLDREGDQVFSWVQLIAKIGPPVFIVGLLLLIATLEQVLLANGKGSSLSLTELVNHYWTILQPWPLFGVSQSHWIIDRPGFLLIALGSAGLILAWRVDINEFSMHHFYKNRLVRCYLGASNENRCVNPFTGFDSLDDFFLSELRATAEKPYLGPYPILNATLNLSTGEQLAWQERKGASYIFTPRYCGFDAEGWINATGSKPVEKRSPTVDRGSSSNESHPSRDGSKSKSREAQPTPAKCSVVDPLRPLGYRKTDNYSQANGPLLGTAMGISGAAANPNQGYNTSPAVSFLMTMFNVRLGWWVGNPRRDNSSRLSSPRFGLLALFSELLGSTDDETRFVNLSDGGHFDNMGLYELVRRRCRYIVLCDAEQDENYRFEGLGSAIRKCRIDFGAMIEIDPARIMPKNKETFSESHCVVGKIRYLDGTEGTLLYIKASVTGDEPEDVIQYRAAKAHFPHETTADQWFTESQFESYRALGFHATHNSLKPVSGWSAWNPLQPNVSVLFDALRAGWYPINPHLSDSGSRHTATLSGLLDRIRKDSNLHALGADLFPGGGSVPAGTARHPVEEFYFSMCVLQLVEDLYHDLHLDQKIWFKDPRIGGWQNLFQKWKKVPAVASAWAVQRDTFRKDFQQFWADL